jgi:hypothetical protein
VSGEPDGMVLVAFEGVVNIGVDRPVVIDDLW